VNEQVLRLEVPIDNVALVQVLPCKDDLGGIKLGDVVIEAVTDPKLSATLHDTSSSLVPSSSTQVVEHFASRHVLHHQVQVALVLEEPDEVDDKRAANLVQNLLLVLCVVDLLHLYRNGIEIGRMGTKRSSYPHDLFLLQDFDGDALAGALVNREHDTAKRTSAWGVNSCVSRKKNKNTTQATTIKTAGTYQVSSSSQSRPVSGSTLCRRRLWQLQL